MGKYDDAIGSIELKVSVKEVLDEASSNEVDKKLKEKQKNREQEVKIKISAEDALKDLERLNKAAKDTKKNLENAVSSGKGFNVIKRYETSMGAIKQQMEALPDSIKKNNKLYKESQTIFKDTDKILKKLTVTQKELNAAQKDNVGTKSTAKKSEKALEKQTELTEQQNKISEVTTKAMVDGANKQVEAKKKVAKAKQEDIKITEKLARKEKVLSEAKRMRESSEVASYEPKNYNAARKFLKEYADRVSELGSKRDYKVSNLIDFDAVEKELIQAEATFVAFYDKINEIFSGKLNDTTGKGAALKVRNIYTDIMGGMDGISGGAYTVRERIRLAEEEAKSIDSTTKFLERQGKVYKTISVQKDNAFPKNEHAKKLAVEATTAAIEGQIATAVQEIPKVIKNYQDLKTVLQECERLAGQQIKYSKPDIIDLVESLRYRGSVSGYYPDDPRRIDTITEAWNAYKKLEGTVESTNKDLLIAKDRITALAVDYARSHNKLSALNNKELELFTKEKYDEYSTAKSHYNYEWGQYGTNKKYNDQLFSQMSSIRGSILQDISKDIHSQVLGLVNQVILKGGTAESVLTPLSQLMGLDDLGQFKKNIEPMVQGFMEIDPAKIKFTELCDAIQNTGMTAEEAIKQFNEFKSGIDTTTVAAEKQVDGMGKLTQLIDELTSKYGKNSFDNIFGGTIADFGTLNASNAIVLYDALIERENKHIIQLQREARQREVNRRHIEEFVGYFKENQEKITAIPNGLQQYGILVAEISRGALNAKDAIAQLNNEIKKSKAPTVVGISQPTTPKGITADTQPTVVGITQPTTPKGITVEKEITQELEKQSKVLKGVNISSITKGLRFGQDSQKVAQSMIADYLTEYANATSLELKGDTDKAADSYTKAFDMLDKIYDYFNKNATIRDKSYADNSQYTKFLEYIKKYPLQYTDYDKNSFGQSEWKEIVNKYAKGNSPVLTNDSRAMTADQMWGDLTDNFSELFRDNLISNSNAEDKFRHILDMVDEARNKAKDLRKTIDIPIGNDGLQEIGIKIEEATNKTVENVRKAYEIEKNITAEKQSQSLVEDIRAKNTEEALKQIRKAKDNQTSLIDLSGIFNTDDLADELRNMANLAVNKDGYVVDKVKVKDSVAMVKLYNKELETTVYQTYQMKAASEDAASQLAFVGETIEHNVKALRNNKIDIDFEKRFANAQIDNLIQPLKGAKYEGEENLRKLADGIVDAGSLKTFTNELKIAKTEVSTFKKELASDLDTTTKMSNTMLKAAGIIKSYRQEYEKLKDTIGSDILKSQINTMESAFGKYNATNELEEQVKAFNEFDKAKRLYDSNVKSVKASQQEATNVQKSINESWKNVFQNNYKYNNGKTSDDQVALNAMSDFYKKQAQEAKESFDRQEKEAQEFKNNTKSIYTDLISTLQQINTLDSKINDLSLKDGGSGLYSASIQSLQTQKSGLVANMRSITDEINRTVNASANENGMAKFFDVAKQKAILTSAEIEKFDQLLLQADRTGFEFASKVTGKIQPVIEKLQALNKAVSDGAITNPDMIRGIDVMSTTLSSKFNKFKEFGDAASAMDAMNYSDSISQNVTALDKLIQTEAQYFSGQQKYSDKMKFNNLNTLSTDVKNTINEMDDAKTRLSKAMTEFSDGKAIVTGFKQSADGISTINFSILDTATNSMRQFSMATGTADKNLYVVETSITKTAQKMQNAEQQVTKMSTLLHTLGASGFDIVPETAHSDVQRLIDLMNKLNKAARAGDVTKVDELMQDAKLATSEVQKLYNESIKLQNAMDDGTARKIGNYNVGSTVTDFDQLSAAVRRHAADVEGASLKVGKFDEKHNKLNYTLTHGNGNVEHYTASINSLGKTINSQHQGVTKLQSGWKQLGGIISKSAKQMTMAIMGYNVFYQVIAKVRQGVTYIKEIDMAMTELKKVTDETAKSYETFVKNAAANGSKIGATVSDYVNAAADFARLGYEMNEAGKMAEAAIVYKNVADGLDTIEASTESITSTMKAFGIESSGTMGIIDSFNEVGNNFAITSAGIGEALKRSASALDAGGNTLEESIGLITGANTVVQNPETVGTALKTLSLRIRGVKTELEEAGLETENMAETTSQLQAKLLALTHGKVDIMIDENNFKSTYQILEDMSKVWEEMTDVEQAAALELIGGKRQANILASLISNFEVAQNATETAANSAGSALKENEVYLDSIDGKTQLLTNSMQNLWNNAVSSEGVKMFLDIANAIVKVTDKVGLLNVAISGLFAYLSASGKNNFLKFFTFNTKDPMRAVESNWLWNGKGGLFEGLRVAFSQIQPNKDGAGKIFDTTGIKNYVSAVKTAAAQESDFNKVKALGTALTNASSVADIKKAATAKAVGIASTVASVGVSALNMALTMGLGLLVGAAITGIMTMIDNAVHRAENLKQEVQELTDAYNEAKKSYSDNLDKLTTSSDTGIYSTLLDEFNALTQGVNRNGDNISLTADQYDRYREICETICEINPNLIAGYDSATEAIGNNVNALENLIETQERERQHEAYEYTSDENIEKYAEDAINDYNEAEKDFNKAEKKLKDTFELEFQKKFKINSDKDGGKEAVRQFLEDSGMRPEDINAELAKYTDGITGELDFDTWVSDNVDYISEHLHGYSDDLQNAAAEYRNASTDIETAKDGVVNELLEVPVGMEQYADLGNSEKSFITEWIKNSDLFKVDENTTSATVLGMKQTIKDIVQNIAEGDYYTNVNGKKIAATDILDSIFDFDATGVDWGKYQERMNEYVDYLWKAIGGDNNKFGFKDKDALKLSLGIDFQLEDETKMIRRYAELKGVTNEKAQDYFDSLPAAEVQRLLQVDWNIVDKNNIDEILEPKISTGTPVQNYSTVAAEVTKYTEALAEARDIVSDNTVVTQDFYDGLVDLVGSEERVAECFDATNPLMVKNAEALNELVTEAERNVEANVSLAQSQARLKYYDLVEALNDVCDVTKDLTDKQIENADSIMDQIDAAQLAIYKYQLLKETLSEAGKEYQHYQESQAVDELNTSGDNYVEMAQTIYDAFNVTGQTGTRAFDAAVQSLVPDSVYMGLKNDGEKLAAIYDYFNKKVLPSLTLEKTSDDSDEGMLSIDVVDVENFIDKWTGKDGLFTGSADKGLNLVEGMNLEKACKLTGQTEAYIKAMFAEIDKYTYSSAKTSFLSELDDSTEGQIINVTSQLQLLNEEKLALLKDGGYKKNKERIKEINKEIGTWNKELSALREQAVESYEAFEDNQKAIEGLETIEDKTRELTKEESDMLGLEWDEVKGKEVQEVIDLLLEKKILLEEPTELTVEFAKEGVVDDIDDLIDEIEDEKKIKLGITYDEDTGEYKIDENNKNVTRDPETGEYQVNIEGELGDELENKLNTLNSINAWLDTGLVTTETLLEDIKSTLNSLHKEVTGKDAPGSESSVKSNEDKGYSSTSSTTETQGKVRNWTDKLFPPDTEKKVTRISNAVKILNSEKAVLEKNGISDDEQIRLDEINKELEEQENLLNGLSEEAYNTWQEYSGIDNSMNAIKGSAKDLESVKFDDLNLDIDTHGIETKGKTAARVFEELRIKRDALDEPTEIEVGLMIDNVDNKIAELKAKLDDPQQLKIQAEKDGVSVEKVKESIKNDIKTLEEEKATIQTTYKVTATEEAEGSNKGGILGRLSALAQYVIADKSFKITSDVQDEIDDVKTLNRATIKDKEYTVTKNIVTKGSGTVGVDGTAHVGGTAFAGGKWGAQETTTALVGELGPEMRVRNGRWELIGENGAEFSDVRQGDIIFNHKQTEDLLKNGYVTSRGKAYAGGKSINMSNPEIKQIDTNALSNSLNNATDAVNEFQGNVANANENIQENNQVNAKIYEGWLSKGKFEDGYQRGDVSKTTIGTITDASLSITTGLSRIGEGLVDTIAYGVGARAKSAGEDEFAKKTQDFIERSLVDEYNVGEKVLKASPVFYAVKSLNDLLNNGDHENASVLGYKSDSLVEAGGTLAGVAGLQALGVPWYVTSGVTSFGSGVESAFNEDATYGEAAISAAITTGAEILTEKIGGIKFGGNTLSDKVIGSLTNGMSNEFVKKITEFGIGNVLLGEGTEEVFSEAISRFGQLLTYEDDKTFKEMLLSKDSFDSYLGSYIGGFLLGEGSHAVKSIGLKNNVNNGFISGSNNQANTLEDLHKKVTAEDFGKPITETLDRIIVNGVDSAYADYFSDGVGIVIKNTIRTMNEDYGGIISHGYGNDATYFSNSADESKNYGGYDVNKDMGDKSPRAVMSDLLMKNPYVVDGRGRTWNSMVDTNIWSESDIKTFTEINKAIEIIQGLKNMYSWGESLEDAIVNMKTVPFFGGRPELDFTNLDFYEELKNNQYLREAREIFYSDKSDKRKSSALSREHKRLDKESKSLGYDNFYESVNDIHPRAKALGHDGVVFLDVADTSKNHKGETIPNDQYVVFSEDQIRNTKEMLDNSLDNGVLKKYNKLDELIAQENVNDAYQHFEHMANLYDNDWDEYIRRNLSRSLTKQKSSEWSIDRYNEDINELQSKKRLNKSDKEELARYKEMLESEKAEKEKYDKEVEKWQNYRDNKPVREEFLKSYVDKLDSFIELNMRSGIPMPNKITGGLTKEQYDNLQNLKNNKYTSTDAKNQTDEPKTYKKQYNVNDALEARRAKKELDDMRKETAAHIKNMNEAVFGDTLNQQDSLKYTQEIQEKQQEINELKAQIAKYTKSAEDYAGSDNFNQDIYDNMSNVINIEKEKVQTLESEIAELQSKLAALNNTPKVNEEGNTEYEVTGTGQDAVKEIETHWGNVPETKTTNYTITKTTIEETKKKDGFLDNLFGGGDVNGTAHANGNWGAPKTETALTGELGPEMIVRGNRWFTVGDNGAEFTDIQKGDIIFNHKQTEELLKNGYITSRGKLQGGSAHAQGTAYNGATWSVEKKEPGLSSPGWRSKRKGNYTKNKKNEYDELFDWFEIRLEELNEKIDLFNSKLENAATLDKKNDFLDKIIDANDNKLAALKKGKELYEKTAEDFLKRKDSKGNYLIPSKYWKEARNGKIAIQQFTGDAGQETVEAIQKYREYAQKVADVEKQIQETQKAIAQSAKQKIDNIADRYDKRINYYDRSKQNKAQSKMDLQEAKGTVDSEKHYSKIINSGYSTLIKEEKQAQEKLIDQRNKMQASLNKSVKNGEIKKWSDEWWEAQEAIQSVNEQIDETKVNIQEFKNNRFDTKFGSVQDYYQNRIDTYDTARQDDVQNYMDLQQAQGKRLSEKSYNKLIKEEGQKQDRLIKQRNEMQKLLNESVNNGDIKKYSDKWWEAVQAIQGVDKEIDETNISMQEWQNDIDDLKWDNFDKLIDRLDTVQEELNNIIDLMGEVEKPVTTPDKEGGWGSDDVEWTGEGLMSIGLHAANMETAQIEAQKIQKELADLKANKDKYIAEHGEDKYNEKIKELTSSQYAQIKSYNDSKNAIVDLNKARVDAIKEGIQKEIEAQEELINKKKEELSAQKELYDFNKKVADQKKSISEIDRQLAALAGDNSASANAKRKQLEAEKAKAEQELQDSYYDRSVTKQQEALDTELELFKESKEDEIELLDKYLEDTEQVVKDSFATFLSNQEIANQALLDLQSQFGLEFSDAVQAMFNSENPLVDSYDGNNFSEDKTDGSSATEQAAQGITSDENKQVTTANDNASDENKEIDNQNETITEEKEDKFAPGKKVSANKGTQVYKEDGTKWFKTDYDTNYTVISTDDKTGFVKVKNSNGAIRYIKVDDLSDKNIEYYKKYTGNSNSLIKALKAVDAPTSKGHRKKIAAANGINNYDGKAIHDKKLLSLLKNGKLKKFAKGSKSIDSDQLAWLDELGEELQIVPNGSGRLDYVKKGTGIIPADMTERLMDLAMNPQDMIDRNRPGIAMSPSVTHNEINITMDIAEVVHIDHVDSNTVPDITKAVEKQLDKYMQNLNNKLKKHTR